ncbi:MAG: PHA/PHB synthase family protein [Solirubrobacterales bacterium]
MASAKAKTAASTNGHRNGDDPVRAKAGGESPGAGDVLGVLMTDQAAGAARRWLPGRDGAKLVGKLATKPGVIAGMGLGYATQLGRAAMGNGDLEPDKGDQRFKDPAWQHNPAFRALCQAYLATDNTVDGLIDAAQLDWHTERKVRFASRNVMEAMAPTNFPLLNPTVLKAVVDTGGLNFVKGAQKFVSDMSTAPRIPSKVDTDAFEVGENLAVTPGKVVLETEVFELIQYEPTTETVFEVPMLMVPPMINKFYIGDISPGRSMIEHFVSKGVQTFTLSWRNPDERHSDWNFDTYARSVIDALDAVEQITASAKTHLLGLCAGGQVATATTAHLTAKGQDDRVAGLSLGVCVLDQDRAGMAGAFVDRPTAAAAIAQSARKGYVDGSALAGVFAWLRPTDLVWRYWVNNYLLGKEPPKFDVLYWNADATRMAAGLHADFMRLAVENAFVNPGAFEVLGTPIDVSDVTVSTYLVAGISDHISPWRDCYRTTEMLGSEPRFVLSNSGHIVAMVNPPGSDRASFQVNDSELPSDPEQWLEGSTEHKGTWWDDWTLWLSRRSGARVAAPEELGSEEFEPLRDAPGRYVHG